MRSIKYNIVWEGLSRIGYMTKECSYKHMVHISQYAICQV